MGDTSSLMSLMLLIIPIGLVIYFIRKKKNKDNSPTISKRRENDEVWKTLKSYIKKNSEIGKEIIESYVAKRPPENYIDRSLSKEEIKKAKNEIKDREKAEKEKIKKLKSEGKRYKHPGQKELYVVLFTTRNPKTLKEDKPRAIECQVINKKVGKKDFEREIIVTKELKYEDEIKWVLPIKEKEEFQYKKEIDKKQKNKTRNDKIKTKLKIKSKIDKKKQ